jgi:hypothetical protein
MAVNARADDAQERMRAVLETRSRAWRGGWTPPWPERRLALL